MATTESTENIPYAARALALTSTDWERLGLDDELPNSELGDAKQQLFDSMVERVTALLLVRTVAVLVQEKQQDADGDSQQQQPVFADLSTSTICRTVLLEGKPWSAYAPGVTPELIDQLRDYVRTILSGYNDTPYHCSEHAFHVFLSVNKLVDMMLQTDPSQIKTYGLRKDALGHLAMLFSALIHDVEHKGVPNRQLQKEHDPLAVLYNDQSVAEQRSLHVGFSTLLQPEYKLLRQTLFGLKSSEDELDSDAYWYFRKVVIDLVLNTDIASPERTQLSKSKFKEAFGETFESMERKLKHQMNSGKVTEEGSGDEISLSDSDSESPEPSVNEDDPAVATGSTTGSVGATNSSGLSTVRPKISVLDSFKNKDKIDYGYQQNLSNSGRGNSGGRRKMLRVNSLASGGRRASVQLLQEDEVFAAKFQRRLSTMQQIPSASRNSSSCFRMRLGIRRSMDLSGEALQKYPSTRHSPSKTDLDEPDELKAAVVMETIMTAADVGHNLQGWDQVCSTDDNDDDDDIML